MSNENFDVSFTELRSKDVINAGDGRRLGKITDLIFNTESGKIKGIVTPYVKRSLFSKSQDVFIPWRCVKKLGEDVIIVDISNLNQQDDNLVGECGSELPPPKPQKPSKPHSPGPSCDRKCEKCMLFDCEHRWKR